MSHRRLSTECNGLKLTTTLVRGYNPADIAIANQVLSIAPASHSLEIHPKTGVSVQRQVRATGWFVVRLAFITLRLTLRLSRGWRSGEEIAPKRSKGPPEKRGWAVPRPGLRWRRRSSEPAAGSTRPPNSGSPPPPPSPLASGFSFSRSSDFGESLIPPGAQSDVPPPPARASSAAPPRSGYGRGPVAAVVLRLGC